MAIRTILSILLLLTTSTLQARDVSFGEWAYDYFVNGATVKLGAGARLAGIRVNRLSDNAEGRIVQRRDQSYFLTYSTRPVFFSIENTGMTFVFNLSNFNAGEQEVGKDNFVDVGSRANGRLYYVVPTAFYQWGDYVRGTYARLGLGLGVGVAEFNGNILLTSTPGNDNVSLSQSGASVTFASSLVIEGHWNNWGITFQYAGPVYETSDYQFNVEDISVNLGYQFVF